MNYEPLLIAYDESRLVPFLGAGMSMGACVSWDTLLSKLEEKASLPKCVGDADPTARAFAALRKLSRQGQRVEEVIRKVLYEYPAPEVTKPTEALANLWWPLICTTNYDDLYCRAVFQKKVRKKASPEEKVPRVLGRSANDCLSVLRNRSFPAQRTVWALQGFLPNFPKGKSCRFREAMLFVNPSLSDLAAECVLGHSEYRRVANRFPHFRRTFAEIFRSCSFLFLGSSLGEPYFLTLFDEIIELIGPPLHPHFAVVPTGTIDPEFLESQYNITCLEYELKNGSDAHAKQLQWIRGLCEAVAQERPRSVMWSARMGSPQLVRHCHSVPHFAVVRASGPKASELPRSEVVAISCGWDRRGPLVSGMGSKMIGLQKLSYTKTKTKHVLQWSTLERSFGIVARELDESGSSRERRTSNAVYTAFKAFLVYIQELDEPPRAAHVQLLSAGKGRTFHPWFSLVQMALAYADWWRETRCSPELCVYLYVVDPSIIALFRSGSLDISRLFGLKAIPIVVEIREPDGRSTLRHLFVPRDAVIGGVLDKVHAVGEPRVSVEPRPKLGAGSMSRTDAQRKTVGEAGLVPGSTLVLDYTF